MKNFFTTYKSSLSFVLIVIVLGGIFTYSKFQTALFPEITFPKIKIIADAGLQPVDKMMVTVTKPLEEAIKKVPDLNYIRSTTSRGSCEISAFMNWDSDIDLGQQRIESKINEIKQNLPPDVQITVEKMNPSILPVMGYTIESKSRSPIELKLLAMNIIKPYLSQVSGVSEVRVIGGKTKEYWIELDKTKMASLSLTPEKINQALSETNFLRSNGYLNDYRYMYLTLTDAMVRNISDIENTLISNDGKRVILLKDIANIKIEEALEYTKINANGKEAVLLAVIKQPNANLITVSEQIEEKIKNMPLLLPNDVNVKPYYLQSDFVNDTIHSVKDCLWIGLFLAIIVAVIFLRSFKASVTILITIPIILCLTLISLYFFGYSFNIMTLGGIAASIGLIIDDAIVVVEQIHRTHEEYPNEPSKTLVQRAVNYLFPAMVGSSISTIVIFIPFLLMTGVAGAYFKVMTNTMIITLVCSFFVTWIGLPVIYLLLTPESDGSREGKPMETHHVKHQAWVPYFIQRPAISIAFMLILVASIIFIIPRLETGFLPEMDEGSIVLDYSSPAGTSLEETDRMLNEVEKLITQTPEVQAYSRRTGTQMGFFITEPNTGDYLIQLKKDRTRTTEEVISDIRHKIEHSQPALRIDFGQVIGDMLGDLITSTQPIELKIFGDNTTKLNQLASEISKIVEGIEGTADVFDGIVVAGPSVSVQPNYNKLAQMGISPANLHYQLQTAQQGSIAGNLLEGEQMTNIRMVYPGNKFQTITSMKNQQIFLPNGNLKPIGSLANIRIDGGESEIQRENLQTMSVVTARLENRDLGSVIKDIQTAISEQIVLPKAYHVEYGGSYAEQQHSFSELLNILFFAGLLVFGTILFLFKSIKLSFLILLMAVLGTSGSLIALFITNTPLNVGSYTGLIMIVGIIGENAIFTYLQFKDSLHQTTVDESIVHAISTRLRPKLMTALGAIIALSPLALAIGTGADMHQPLAIAIIGGFIIALPLLLIVYPTLLRMIATIRTK